MTMTSSFVLYILKDLSRKISNRKQREDLKAFSEFMVTVSESGNVVKVAEFQKLALIHGILLSLLI